MQQDVSQKERQAKVGDRFIASQSLTLLLKILHGPRAGNQGSASAEDVGNEYRSQRCLLAHPHSPKVLELSRIPGEEPVLPVYSAAIWPQHGDQSVLSCHESTEALGTAAGHASFQYLDDWLQFHFLQVLSEHYLQLSKCFQRLGLIVNFEKSEPVPTEKIVFGAITSTLQTA